MSPVFRHGALRLYLLKLLDEAPRHGYDVIRLLQDRFLGVYSPSPGTIYPRLARLEEEGLVTHEVIDGKKVYKITDAGRAELNGRLDDLADLEDELSASVRDIARELTRDVRETVRSLRDEFTWAVREAGRAGSGGAAQARADEAHSRPAEAQQPRPAEAQQPRPAEAQPAAAEAQPAAAETLADQDATAEAARTEAADAAAPEAEGADAAAVGGGGQSVWSKAASESEAKAGAQEARDQEAGAGEGRAGPAGAGPAGTGPAGTGEAGEQAGSRRRWPSGGWREWAEWAERRDWREWADWAEQRDWREWAGKQEWKDWAKAGHQEWKERAKAGKQEWAASGRTRRAADRELVVDLERLAAAFAREIRGVAWPAEALSEDAVGNLGRILTDALNRIKNEVFRPPGPGEKES